jgi:uncharacterized C2H2 Zn-finger protein
VWLGRKADGERKLRSSRCRCQIYTEHLNKSHSSHFTEEQDAEFKKLSRNVSAVQFGAATPTRGAGPNPTEVAESALHSGGHRRKPKRLIHASRFPTLD